MGASKGSIALLATLCLLACLSSGGVVRAQEYTFGQATWYDSILNG